MKLFKSGPHYISDATHRRQQPPFINNNKHNDNDQLTVMANKRKIFIQMSGAPGAGKSTVASLLAKTEVIDAVIINHDLIKAFVLEHNIAFDQASKFTYDLDWLMAGDLMQQGRNVIVDSTCNYDEALEQGIALAQRYGYEYKYVECRIKLDDLDLIDERLRSRGGMISQRTGVDLPPPGANLVRHKIDGRTLYKNWIENPCRPAEKENIIIVDSTGGLEQCVNAVLEHLALSVTTQTDSPRVAND